MCTLSDLKMGSLLDLIDEWARENGLDETAEPPHRPPPTRVEDSPRLGLDLATGEIKTIIWATGYRPDLSWLELPVLDRKGMIRHDGGVVSSPGMYLMAHNSFAVENPLSSMELATTPATLAPIWHSYLDNCNAEGSLNLLLDARSR